MIRIFFLTSLQVITRRFQHGYPARRPAEPWTQLTHRERLPEWVAYNPRTMRPPPLSSDTNSMKILSYNVNGLQAAVQSGFSALELAHSENFDVLCLQDTSGGKF
jgi:exodeoxyribonuclease III